MRLPEQTKPVPSLSGGPLPLVLASVFALDLITALIVVGFGNAYLVRVLQSPPAYPAFALAVYGTVKLVSAPFAGRLVDRAPGWVSALAAASLEGGGIAIMLLSGTAEGYIIGVAPLSAGTVVGWLLVLRRLGETLEPGGRGPASSFIALAGSIGLGSGFALAALLAEQAEPRLAFVAGLVVVISSVFALGRLGARPIARRGGGVGWFETPTRRELAAALVLFAHLGTIGSVAVTFGPFALGELGQTLLRLAFLLAPAVAAGGVGMFVAGRRSQHGSRLREAAPLYAVAGVAALFCATTTDIRLFALGAVPLGAAIGAVGPVVNAARIDVASEAQAPGSVLARLSIAEGLGEASIPFLAGLAINVGGPRAGMVAVGLALGVIALLTGAAARASRL